jgi:hypothetical protein
MEEQAYIGELISAFIYLYAGTRLLRLSSRTGEAPERLLGSMFLVTGISLILYDIPIILNSEALWTPLNFAGRVTYVPAPVLLAVFTRRVFNPESAWATWMVYGTAILLVTGVGGSVWSGDLEGFSISSPWFWTEWTGYTIPYAWAGAEALAHHRQARRRLRLGLCDPLICNRYLLWGFFGAMQVLVSLAVIGSYAAYELEGGFTLGWDALISAGEIFSLALIGLIFFSPAVYRRWVNGNSPATKAEES